MLPYGVAANIVCSATGDAGAHGAEGATDVCAQVRDDRDAGDQDQGKHDCVFDGGGSVITSQESGYQRNQAIHGLGSPRRPEKREPEWVRALYQDYFDFPEWVSAKSE